MEQTEPRKSYSEYEMKAMIELTKRACKAEGGFKFFIENVFAKSFEKFVNGEYISNVAKRMEANDWTMDVTARDHFKSTRLYAEIMYDIFTADKNIEGHYFSYNLSMSSYHLAKVKQLIACNPYYQHITNLNRKSASTIDFYNGKARVWIVPEGLLSFKRGIHADRIYIDDPLKDPENKLAPTVIYRINNVIKVEIFPMVNRNGKCRIVGTPQTNHDFFFDEDLRGKFSVSIKPAIVDEVNGIAVFPEWKSYAELVEIRNTIGEKPFNQEYMAKPSYTEDSYIERKKLMAVVDKDLKPQKAYMDDYDVVGGFDIGKKAHPSHIALYERRRDNESGKWVYKQLLTKWLDHVDYKDQLDIVKNLCEDFRVSRMLYDNTRSEFEAFAEQGLLPRCMEAVVFGMRKNQEMAVSFETVIKEERCTMINDTRQIDQILQVNADLQCVESPMGHGDSFWSNALALYEPKETTYRVRGF